MNTRITLSAALAATALFALAPAQAQAPGTGSALETLRLETKIEAMQQKISALQAQVQQLRAVSPSRVTGPAYQMPSFAVPKFNVPNLTLPNMTLPNTLPNNPQLFIAPQPHSRDNSIPNYTATFIKQAAR